jgi:hypothetical protein
MGSGGAKAHESFTVAPTTVAIATEALDDEAPAAVADALAPVLSAALASDAPIADLYAGLCQAVEGANAQLAAAATDGTAAADDVAAAQGAIKDATGVFLKSLPAEELHVLAADAGFVHPHLVGLSGTGDHPLVHWLDPAYPPGSPSKAKIAAKADERYAQLAAGETVGGLSLADVQALEALVGVSPPPTATSWTASAADIVALQAAVTNHAIGFQSTTGPERAAALAALIDAENRLVTAECPDLGSHVAEAAAAATAHVTKAVGHYHATRDILGPAVEAAIADGRMTTVDAKFLSPSEQIALLRHATAADERTTLTATAAERSAHLASALEHQPTLVQAYKPGAAMQLPPLTDPGSEAALLTVATAAQHTFTAADQAKGWLSSADLSADERQALWAYSYGGAAQVTTAFRMWAKGQPLTSLRDAATKLGLENAAAANRAQIQNYIAGQWDSSHNPAAIQTSVSAAVGAPKSKKPPSTPSLAGVPANVVQLAKATPPAAPDSFGARHAVLVAALKHHTASHAGLPERVPQDQIESWAFTAAEKSTALGGAHSKSLHTAPDGSTWMFKPDKTAHGARAHAEMAASEVLHAVGLPSVPVRIATIKGQSGAIQPLLAGATPLASQPSAWSQADVDAIVRLHVGAWAIGDHDGHANNVLRTAAGGLVPCDQGQAFKYFGRDKLSADYHPNATFGASNPVFHQAYAAAKSGGLATGVKIRPEAALPVIAAFERLDDAQYRAMLHSTAHEGAKRDVHWAAEMRKRAAKRHGVTASQVSHTQVAEEFLDYAVSRKNGLRTAFTAFFAGEGFAGAAKLAQVA